MGIKHVVAGLGFVAIAVGAAWPAQGAGRPPLLADRTGDVGQYVQACPAGSLCVTNPGTDEADLDLVAADMTADSAAITGTVVVDDLGFARTATTPVPGSYTHYMVVMSLEHGFLYLSGFRDVATGSMTFGAMYQEFESVVLRGFWPVANVTGSADTATGSVSITASFADLNAALAAAGRAPIGLGTPVKVSAETLRGTPAMASYMADVADSGAVDYVLGD